MESNVLKKDHQALIDLSRAMSPEERLEAFYQHSQLLVQIQESGKVSSKRASPKNHSTN